MIEAVTIIPIAIRKLKRVNMLLPPPHLFDEPLGCAGNRRLFALWWSRADQAPVLNDGFFESVGVPVFYRVWRYHPAVIAALAGYNIGDAAITADYWLLVDRKSRVLYVGKVWDVLNVLDFQKSGIPVPLHETGPVPDFSDPMDIQGEGAVVPSKGFKKPMNSDNKLLNELEEWLDANMKGG
jgi:hypothetical protein